ncbi:MAG: glycosyltransferase [Candidatus Peregrinibacteria bacterium]|nr:glycosyltransferase [Candidatus Peregrinibacteria bacterium]
MRKGISACIVLYNDGKIVEKCLKSIKDVVDEILIVHDGPCKNNTLDICRKYTNKIFIREHKGTCEFHQAFLYKKAKYEWILKIDADEFLTKELKKNIRKLIKNTKIDAYSFLWPYWENGKYLTKKGPRKMNLYRKSKISYIGFPNWGEPKINGKIEITDYRLGHHSPSGDPTKWRTFLNKDIRWITFTQAQNYSKKITEFENFQYKEKDFPKYVLIRNKYPLLTALPFGVIAALKSLIRINSSDTKIILKAIGLNFIRYLFLGYFIFRLKKNPNYSPCKKSFWEEYTKDR